MKQSSKRTEESEFTVLVTGRNMPVSEALEKYAVNKMGKLERYLDRLTDLHLVLAGENTRESDGRNVAEATAVVNGRVLRAEVANANMYAAIDGVVDKMQLQLTRQKERMKIRKGHGGLDLEAETTESSAMDVLDEVEPAEDGRRIVRVKQFTLKPMFSDEAVDEMEDVGHSFYVFLNAENEQVSVVYRRSNGSYGLIEPAFE